MYEYEKVGRVFVDSGQLAVGDPCYTLAHPETIGDGELKFSDDREEVLPDKSIGGLNQYTKFCEATLFGDKPYGMVDGGVAFNTSTTHGDGSYAVTIVKDEFGRQTGMSIDLDGNDRDIQVFEPEGDEGEFYG